MPKKQKSLLNESTVRRFMKLAGTPELSDSFVNEEWGTKKDEDSKTREGEEDYTTKKGEEKKTTGNRRGTKKGDEAYNENLFAEDEHEEDELEAAEGELGHEDDIADEEGAELDAEAPAEGEAEITPEAAQAIVDLAASLEASGALEGTEAEVEVEGEEEIETGVEDFEAGAEEEELAEFRGLSEKLAKLGIEVVDDRQLKETVYKRVIKRLTNEQRRAKKVKQTDRLVERIFARLQRESRKATKRR